MLDGARHQSSKPLKERGQRARNDLATLHDRCVDDALGLVQPDDDDYGLVLDIHEDAREVADSIQDLCRYVCRYKTWAKSFPCP